eukprot:3516327-Pyramimonas_sp.AAC.1
MPSFGIEGVQGHVPHLRAVQGMAARRARRTPARSCNCTACRCLLLSAVMEMGVREYCCPSNYPHCSLRH